MRKACNKIMEEIRVLNRILDRNMNPATRSASSSLASLQYTKNELAKLKDKPEIAQFEMLEQLRAGAAFLLGKIKEYKDSKKPKGIAVHYFIMAILWTGCTFQAQHGGTELTNGNVLAMLESWKRIFETVCGAYKVDSEKHEMVRQILEKATVIATPLFEITTMMKSQQKWDKARLGRYKKLAADVYLNWYDLFPWQGVFPKMHDFMVHVPKFIQEHGFYGRGSEESFESYHNRHKLIAKNVQSMKDDKHRTEVINWRLQLPFDLEVEEILTNAKEQSTRCPRGKYNRSQVERTLPIERYESEVDDNYIKLPDDMAIKKEWNDVFRMAVAGEVPKPWRNNFMNRNDLSTQQKADGIYSSCLKK